MFLGKRILYLRKKRGLTQDQLSKGIISSTHLSNIECGRFDLKLDIIPLLAKKLNVELDYLVKVKEVDAILSDSLILLEEYLHSKLIQAQILYEQIISEYPFIYCLEQEFYFTLLEKLLFIRTKDFKKASLSAQKIEDLFDEKEFLFLEPKTKKLYFYVNALYSYFQKDYLKSHEYYLKILPLIYDDVEKARNYFNISLVLIKQNDTFNALTYANLSLEIYLLAHELEKAIDVYIFLAVLYWENNQIELAEKTIHKAKKLSKKYTINRNLDKIYHNIGLINQSKKEYKIALSYFKKSLKLKSKQNTNLFVTYRSLIEIYLELKDLHSAKSYLEKAFSYCNNQIDHSLLNVLSAKVDLVEGNSNKYEQEMEDSIELLYELKEMKNLVDLVEELGTYFQINKKYKKAAYYFKLGLIAQKVERGLL